MEQSVQSYDVQSKDDFGQVELEEAPAPIFFLREDGEVFFKNKAFRDVEKHADVLSFSAASTIKAIARDALPDFVGSTDAVNAFLPQEVRDALPGDQNGLVMTRHGPPANGYIIVALKRVAEFKVHEKVEAAVDTFQIATKDNVVAQMTYWKALQKGPGGSIEIQLVSNFHESPRHDGDSLTLHLDSIKDEPWCRDPQEIMSYVEKLAAGEAQPPCVFGVYDKKGQERFYESYGRPASGRNGIVATGTFIDVTDRIKAERMRHAGVWMAEAQFKISALIDEFADHITKMGWAMEFIDPAVTLPEVQAELDKVEQRLDSCQGLLRKMTRFAGERSPETIRGNHENPKSTRFDNNFVDYVYDTAQSCITGDWLTMERDIKEPVMLPEVENRIVGTAMSLVSRADKAIRDRMERGDDFQPKIEMEAQCRPASEVDLDITNGAKEYLHLSIQDNGTKIPGSVQRDFLTAGSESEEMSSGALGLRSINSLACALGGAMKVSSPRRWGTRVDIYLPIPSAENATFLGVNI